jgi:transposase
MSAITGRCGGNPARLRKMGYEKFAAAVRRELPRWGASKLRHRIVQGLWDALADAGGVASQRRGALERVRLVLGDWMSLLARLADTGERMTGILDELGLTALVTSIDGLSATGAAVILAETGDLTRFSSARAVVKHAGLNPAENTSATITGRTRIARRGRPRLRTAAWRAVWGGMRHNQVLQDKYQHLTGRDGDRLNDGQARTACAAALLRWLHAVVTTRREWDPKVASGAVIPARHGTAPGRQAA